MTDGQLIDHWLGACEQSALHLEMRDAYTSDDPDYDAWLSGHQLDPSDRTSWWRPWLQNIVDATARGVVVRRARIVSEPVSAYIRYEYDLTFPNERVGEQVRWLPRRRASGLALPGNDFWLFDRRILLINHHNGDGDWIDIEHVTDPGTIKLCATAFESVWERAIPHNQYRPA